jgi:hypothetical protein
MKKIFGIFIITGSLFFSGCADDCDPGQLPVDEILFINIVNPGGNSYIKYTNNALPDSVKVLNIGTNTLLNRYLISDSILVIEGYDKANNTISNLKISKGTVLKPDTLQITTMQSLIEDNCGRQFSRARITTVKANNTVLCTGCVYNTLRIIQR